jgi:hypothetical protein
MMRLFGLGAVAFAAAMAPAAAPAHPAGTARPITREPAVRYALRRLPDIVLTGLAPAHARRMVIADDVDWAMASPGGAHTIAGTDTFTARETTGNGGRAALYPGARPLPVIGIDHRRTHFSPDGRYLAVNSRTGMFRPSTSDPMGRANPTLTVLTIPDLRVVATTPGVDPFWMTPETIVFRRGREPFRLDVRAGSAPVPLGPPQASYGCPTESFSPWTPCRSDIWTTIMAIEPDGSGWIVNDTSDTTKLDTMRLLKFASGESHPLFALNEGDTSVRANFVSYEAPSKNRTCEAHTSLGAPTGGELWCVQLPSEAEERIVVADEEFSARWLDGDRMLLYFEHGYGIADLRARTVARIVGVPATSKYPEPVALGTKLLFTSSGELVDIYARTIREVVPVSASNHLWVTDIPGSEHRFLMRLTPSRGTPRWEWAEL